MPSPDSAPPSSLAVSAPPHSSCPCNRVVPLLPPSRGNFLLFLPFPFFELSLFPAKPRQARQRGSGFPPTPPPRVKAPGWSRGGGEAPSASNLFRSLPSLLSPVRIPFCSPQIYLFILFIFPVPMRPSLAALSIPAVFFSIFAYSAVFCSVLRFSGLQAPSSRHPFSSWAELHIAALLVEEDRMELCP